MLNQKSHNNLINNNNNKIRSKNINQRILIYVQYLLEIQKKILQKRMQKTILKIVALLLKQHQEEINILAHNMHMSNSRKLKLQMMPQCLVRVLLEAEKYLYFQKELIQEVEVKELKDQEANLLEKEDMYTLIKSRVEVLIEELVNERVKRIIFVFQKQKNIKKNTNNISFNHCFKKKDQKKNIGLDILNPLY